MTPEKSLDIITKMIQESKQSFKHYSFYFLLWGWLMFSASIVEYILLEVDYPYHYASWIVFSVIGGIVSTIRGRQEESRSISFADKIISAVWGGFVVSIIITLIFFIPDNPNPVILTFAGLATYISGVICDYKGFKYGGMFFWLAACVSYVLAPDTGIGLLVYALAMLLGYIIPGYRLKKMN